MGSKPTRRRRKKQEEEQGGKILNFFLKQKSGTGRNMYFGRNWLECSECLEIGWNWIRGGMRGIMVPVFMPVQNFLAVSVGTE